jgi:molybdate transport system substrate-binding protein
VRSRSALSIVAAIAIASTAHPAAGSADTGSTLTVFAAASLADAFGEIGKVVERERPGLRVRFNFAGSNQLALQIEQDAQADVFASADDQWMSHVRDHAMLAGDSQVFARNRLVAIVPRTNPARISALPDLAKPGVKLVLAAGAVPAGRYSREVLRNLSKLPGFGESFARRALANLVSEEDNVRAVVAKVQIGEADAGICYSSDATGSAARYVRVFEIPDSANVLASYPIAVLKNARRAEDAQVFVERVLSPDGQKILARHGLIPVTTR